MINSSRRPSVQFRHWVCSRDPRIESTSPVLHTELVGEIANEPDYDAAIKALK